MKLLAISGSLRAASSTGALVRAAVRLAPPGIVVDVYDCLGLLPHFDPDLDVEPFPDPVATLRATLGTCHGLVIAGRSNWARVEALLRNRAFIRDSN